jgi:hypothetical protein
MKISIFSVLLFLTTSFFAQQTKWFRHKNLQGFEGNFKTTYVPSNTSPIIVNHLVEQLPTVPNGPPQPPAQYITAHDTAGTELWIRKVVQVFNGYQYPADICAILQHDKDKFWLVVGQAMDTVKVGNFYVTSSLHDSIYGAYYFIQMSRSGNVLNYFTFARKWDVLIQFGDIVLDGNGDFIVSGGVMVNLNSPYPWTSRPFSFGTYSTTLQPSSVKDFVGKINQNGSESNFFQFDYNYDPVSWTYFDMSVIMQVEVNTNNGNIAFVGMLGDTLTIGSNTMINTMSQRQLFLGMIDQGFNLMGSKSETVASSGTFLHELKYNPVSNSFYFIGTWDGQLFYGQQTPLTGGIGNLGNDSYLAKLQPNSLNLDTILPVRPFPDTNQTLALSYDIDVAKDGSVYLAAFTEDSVITLGSKMYHLNNPNWNEFPFVSKLSPGLQIDTTLFASTNGISRFNAIDIDKNSIYLGGSINGTFSMGTVGATSSYQLDADLLRLDMNSAAVSEVQLSATGMCKGGILTTTNTSWGYPLPSFTWSANPSAGVTFNPGSSSASPQISFANAGTYTITCVATNTLGSSSDQKQVTVLSCTDIKEDLSDEMIKVKPNPSNGQLEIFLPEDKAYKITIMDVRGRVVYNEKIISLSNNWWKVDISNCENGLYILTLENAWEKLVKQLIIDK